MAQWFRNGLAQSLTSKNVGWTSDALKLTLHTSSYTPSLDNDVFVSALNNELASTAGYTTGGVTLTSTSVTYTAANSWGTSRANSTVYLVGTILRPASANGFLYSISTAGTSGGSLPTYPTTVGATVADGTATLTCVGKGIIVLTAANPLWTTASFTGVRYGVISDRTPGTAATQPLLGLIDFGSDAAAGGGNFAIIFDAQGILQLLVP